ncbi:hypothetical protein OC610_01675 [Pseudomonas sp. SAICEU22]|uniref:Uncharacterized protein n=1 Tax=Pseudomonas agronomica TaxID=2979328 RepID=A0ABT3F210_9PSED|nr:hypothetical protein [Pseudomonas agronomica]
MIGLVCPERYGRKAHCIIGNPAGDPVRPGRTPAERTMILDESSWDDNHGPCYPGGLHYADDKIDAFLQSRV